MLLVCVVQSSHYRSVGRCLSLFGVSSFFPYLSLSLSVSTDRQSISACPFFSYFRLSHDTIHSYTRMAPAVETETLEPVEAAALLALAMAVWLALRCMLALELVRDKLVVERFRPGTLGPVGGWPDNRVTKA